MSQNFNAFLTQEIKAIKDAGLYKGERPIVSQQSAEIAVSGGQDVLNFCANNYLGLANNPKLIDRAKQALDKYGFGMLK